MAWSLGHWLILIVALAVGVGAGWILRGRQGATATRPVAPIVEGDPVATLVTNPASIATIDADRPAATVDPAPGAVADDTPAPDGTDGRDSGRPTASAVADDVDHADMVLTGDPVPPPPSGDTLPLPTPDTDRDGEVVLPVAAEVTGPVPSTDDPAEPAVVAPRPVPDAEHVASPQATSATDDPDTTETTDGIDTTDGITSPVPEPRDSVATPAEDAEGTDDFRRIQGVGPKIAAALQAAGIRTYGQLAALDEAALRDLVRSAGLRSAPSLATWPQQAKVLAGAPGTAAVLPGGSDA